MIFPIRPSFFFSRSEGIDQQVVGPILHRTIIFLAWYSFLMQG